MDGVADGFVRKLLTVDFLFWEVSHRGSLKWGVDLDRGLHSSTIQLNLSRV